MSKAPPKRPAGTVESFDRLVATNPRVERKGATIPYTAVNGNMFSYLSAAGGLALRLPEPARSEFLKKHKTTLCEAYGIVQEEYVTVPDALLSNTKALKKYFDIGYEYAKSLKPKSAKKR
jgi:hypothetical protein